MDDDLNPDDIERLNALIRSSRVESGETIAPSEAAVAAYILGEPTPDQQREVQVALLASPRVREEVAYVAGLRDPEVQKRYDEAPAPPVPVEVELVPTEPKERRTDRGGILRGWGDGGWLRFALGVPALVVIVLFFVLGRPSRPGLVWTEAPRLTMDQLSSDPLRGGADSAAPKTAAERAIWSLGAAVTVEGENVQARALPRFTVSGDRVPISLGGAEPGGIAVEAPPVGATDQEVWLLALPSLRLYQASLAGPRGSMRWPAGQDDAGILVVTYRSGGRFDATTPVECRRR